ncbi:MAG: zinc ribbon domain-containing protein [Bacillota bacterium]|nr:zinc ribbon domain-containing protein [Bacillota bacterium]
MVGIISYGVYIPLWRLDLESLGKGFTGEKAIGNFDEDSLTMGVAAGIDCLRNIDRNTIDGLFFATTTSPYKEKQVAVSAATALNLRQDIMTADFAHSLRAGTTALKVAADVVKAGSARRMMVIASDMRVPMPGSEFEGLFGDGAAAFLIGSDDIRVRITDSCSLADDILDIWREDQDKFVRSWEERFTFEEGYGRVLPIAVSSLMKRNNLSPSDFGKAVFYAPDARRHKGMAKRLGFDGHQVQPPLFGTVGDTGTASALMMTAAALEEAKPGDRMLLASYGNGADAFLLDEVKGFGQSRSVKSYLASKEVLKDYRTYLSWRGLIEMSAGRRRPPNLAPSASAIWREQAQIMRLEGVKCRRCGTVQYPPQRVCYTCHSKDEFESYLFSQRRAHLFTYAADYLTNTPDPPLVVAIIDFDDGGRMSCLMTDKDANDIEIGMPLEMTFRKLFTAEGIHNYFWKCMPGRIKE